LARGRRILEFLVHWTGYSKEDRSWTSAHQFHDDDPPVQEFYKKHPKKPRLSSKPVSGPIATNKSSPVRGKPPVKASSDLRSFFEPRRGKENQAENTGEVTSKGIKGKAKEAQPKETAPKEAAKKSKRKTGSDDSDFVMEEPKTDDDDGDFKSDPNDEDESENSDNGPDSMQEDDVGESQRVMMGEPTLTPQTWKSQSRRIWDG
jgi:hypothetical protein